MLRAIPFKRREGNAGHGRDGFEQVPFREGNPFGSGSLFRFACGQFRYLPADTQFFLEHLGGLVEASFGHEQFLFPEDVFSRAFERRGRAPRRRDAPAVLGKRRGFVEYVDRLVGEIAVMQVTDREIDGEVEKSRRDRDAVERFVCGADSPEEFLRFFG